MPDSSLCRKKKKLTLVASTQGIKTAERALIRLGFASKSNFAVAHLSRTTVNKFFNQVPIQLDSFKTICEALKLKWQEIAGITEESIKYEQIERQVSPSSDIEEGEKLKMRARQVTVVDQLSQTSKAVITLEGDINSISNIEIIAFILKKYGGDTIQITDLQKGSIKLIIEGSQEDIERILIQIQSGELTELDGFPVENAQILSESSEDGESSEHKWRLVEEIVTNQIIWRDLSGADLSEADLRNAYLIGANLSEADLSDSDLIGANLSGAKLSRTNLSGANLSGANLSGAFRNLSSAFRNLSRANLIGADLSDANLTNANLSGANLSDANLMLAKLTNANLFGANLTNADLIGANLTNANLTNANLTNADLIGANLSGANLSGANLFGANLFGIKIEKTKFSDNLGITEELKQHLIKRGAILDYSPGDPLSPHIKKWIRVRQNEIFDKNSKSNSDARPE